MSDQCRLRAVYGDPMPRTGTKRNDMLLIVRHLRALRAWVTPGSYGWFRLTDDIKAVQRKMLGWRLR